MRYFLTTLYFDFSRGMWPSQSDHARMREVFKKREGNGIEIVHYKEQELDEVK
jgi:hypothetical protein